MNEDIKFYLKLAGLASVALLAACGAPQQEPRCMAATESGIIRDSKEWTKHIPGYRGPGYDQPMTTILVEVKGLVRVCEVDEHTEAMLTPGTKVSLINAERKF